MNSVVLIGRLARDPELSYTPNTQTAVTRFTLAVDRPKRDGQEQGADFIRVTVFGRQAETSNQYLAKGRQAAVAGRIQTGSYKNQKGETVYTTDIIADRVEFLGSTEGQNSARVAQNGHMQGYSTPQGNMMPQSNAMGHNQLSSGNGVGVRQDEIAGTGFQQMNIDVPWEV